MKIKPYTYAGYTSTLDLYILPKLGKYKIQNLAAVAISHFAKNKLENGRADGKVGLSAKTVREMQQ